MQGQHMGSRASEEAEIDALVLTLLVEARAPWSLEEVGREPPWGAGSSGRSSRGDCGPQCGRAALHGPGPRRQR
jgi:hypothetical protein